MNGIGSMKRCGFTLLEVVIALAILAVSLMVLIDTQSVAVLETVEGEQMITGTWLAQEKMAEAVLRMEKEGFTLSDLDEEGDFADFGSDGDMSDQVDFGDTFEDYKFAYTVRKVELSLGDIAGSQDELQEAGIGPQPTEDGTNTNANTSTSNPMDALGSMASPEMLSEMLHPYIREVRVLVWWSDEDPDLEEGCDKCIEIVSHVINPTGLIASTGGEETTSESSSSGSSSSGSSSSGSSSSGGRTGSGFGGARSGNK